MAEAVVDLLEVVQVHQRDGERMHPRGGELLLQHFFHVQAVVHAGERVAPRLLAQLAHALLGGPRLLMGLRGILDLAQR